MDIKNLLGNSQKRIYRREIFRQQVAGATRLLIVLILLVLYFFGDELVDRKRTSLKDVGQTVEVKAVEVTPETEKVTDHPIIWLVDKIWLMESSRGKNGVTGSLQKYCEDKGMWNEYGYGGMKLKICFKDQAEADETMIKWFEKQFRTKTESQTLCYYRHGELMSNCDYYQNIIKTK